MSNPKLAVEFAAVGERDVLSSINRVTGAGQTYLEKWVANSKSAVVRNEASYTAFWNKVVAEENRATREMFQMSRTRLAQEERAARRREQAEASASRAIVAQRKAETAELIAEGKRALAAQEAQAKERARVVASAQRQTQLGMESRVSNAGGYGPKLSTTQYGPSIDLKRAHDFQIAEEKRLTRELERENLQRERGESAHQREMARIAKTNRAQLNLENKVVNAGGYGPHLPTAPAQSPDRMATALNTGMVNAAAFLNVATSAYYMASKAVAVVSGFVLEAAKWEQMGMALENMEGGAVSAASAISRLYEIAKAPGIDLETAQYAYLKLRAVSIQGTEAERIIKAFSNTVARGGGSSVQFGRVLEQFTQMRAENRVLQQDLKFMKNSMPELASLMQKAFGTTTAEGIRKLGLNAKDFTDGILAEMEKLPKAQQTLTSEIENTGVAWGRLKAAMVDTDFVKSKLQSLTKVFEALRTAIAGNEQEKARADINAKYGNQIAALKRFGNSPARWLASQMPGVSSALGDEALRGQMAGELDKQRRAELALLDKAYAKPKSIEDELGAFDPNNPFKVRGSKDEKKKKKTSAGEVDLGWNDPKRVKDAKDYAANLYKIEKERRERSMKEFREAREEEFNANKAHQKRVDDWNQAQIDKNREKNQAGNTFLGDIDPLRAIENEYISHYERINAANFASKEERARVNAQFLLKEQAAIRDFYAQQYSIAVSGASDMFGALAELRKKGTSESNDTYQVLFGISKAFAIADATIKLSSAAINAMAVGSSQGIPTMIANIGTTMAMGGALISQITATAYSGVFDKGGNIPVGKWGIAGENGPEIIQGPAHVTSTRDTARLMGSGSGTKVVVNNYAGASVSTKTNSNGEMEILIQRAAEVAEDRISAGIASGGGKVSQQLTRTFGVKR